MSFFIKYDTVLFLGGIAIIVIIYLIYAKIADVRFNRKTSEVLERKHDYCSNRHIVLASRCKVIGTYRKADYIPTSLYYVVTYSEPDWNGLMEYTTVVLDCHNEILRNTKATCIKIDEAMELHHFYEQHISQAIFYHWYGPLEYDDAIEPIHGPQYMNFTW